MYQVATFIEYREVYDRPATLDGLVALIRNLDPTATATLLCQMNADFRLVSRDRDSMAKLQQELAGGMLTDETIARLKQRYGQANMADRPLFHAGQLLNLLRLVTEHSKGDGNPLTDASARYDLGDACLMMNDLLLTESERRAVASPDRESVMRSLMVQSLGPFELQNPAAIQHVAYRSRIMFHELLNNDAICARIGRQCQGFDFNQEFSRLAGVSLSRWLFLLMAFYSYLMHYRLKDGIRHLEFLTIDRLTFGKDTPIPQADLDAALKTLSSTIEELRLALIPPGSADWRFDSVPFRSKPLIELQPGKFCCVDLGLLAEKIHSGAYWTIHDAFLKSDRQKLSIAWGILFEEYVNWFLSGRDFGEINFWPNPQWRTGGEAFDGAFLRGSVFVAMEYKGGFLARGAKYSGGAPSFEKDLETKIIKGCKQLARNIQLVFHKRQRERRELQLVPSEHVTRVVPVLVYQDQILESPLVSWRVNQRFNEVLDRSVLRPGVTVEPLNLVGIRELEVMAESAESGKFDIFGGLQLRCYSDPEMTQNLHNFLMANVPEYGQGKSDRIQTALDAQFAEITKYLFGKSDSPLNSIPRAAA